MPHWITALTVGQLLLWLAAATAVLAALRKVVPAVRKAGRVLDDVIGAPGHPGVLDRLDALERKLQETADLAGSAVVQMHPNGGSSMRDQLDAMRRAQEEILRHLTRLEPPT
jgi:hypothetical protein